jgi:hypothetical protein
MNLNVTNLSTMVYGLSYKNTQNVVCYGIYTVAYGAIASDKQLSGLTGST